MRVPTGAFLLWSIIGSAAAAGRTTVSLAGEWRFELDPKGVGAAESWYARALAGSVRLPGSTALNRQGLTTDDGGTDRLTQRWSYVGRAWYQREIDIPAASSAQRVQILLERTKATRVWVDGREAGAEQVRLFVPHVYDLTGMATPGKHRLTIQVDNGYPFPVSGHALSDDTQTNWNGILGRIELITTDAVWIENARVTPSFEKNTAIFDVAIGNATGAPAGGTLTLSGPAGAPLQVPFRVAGQDQQIHAELPLGADAAAWDEFAPKVQTLGVSLSSGRWRDQREIEFGLRSFGREGTRFVVNGKRTVLRGKHDGSVFPLTGYPPTDVESWLRYFRILKTYGLNHVRFHSWTPPEAAFAAADREGFYLQTELPEWASIPDPANPRRETFMFEEGLAILDAYANHPSFCMLSLGNELSGDRRVLGSMVARLRAHDPRPLYAVGTNAFFFDPLQAPGDDFWVTMRTRQGTAGRTRAAFSHADLPLGHIETGPPNTRNDYSQALAGVTVPVVGHEVGQFQVFPNFDEIPKYNGVLQARNLERLKGGVDRAGLLSQWRDFFRASGAVSVMCYREEIEAALRTPGFGGFQLLDLQDYPGQGTALVGILDAFMDSKGLIRPDEWRHFCGPVVPLLRFDKYTWTSGEAFRADVEVSQFGHSDLSKVVVEWSLTSASGKTVRAGKMLPQDIPQGTLARLGRIEFPLGNFAVPARYDLEVRLAGTPYRNSYPLWVYPEAAPPAAPAGVTLAAEFNAEVERKLAGGGRVLLIPNLSRMPKTNGVLFMTDFWCFPMFEKITKGMHMQPSPGTMGLLVDAGHASLAGFPTGFTTDWQWWHLVKNSRALVLDGVPAGYRPIVQVIDNVFRNQRLGLILETRYGPGRLLISAIDLAAVQDRPEGRQLLRSLLSYAASEQFAPAAAIEPELLRKMLAPRAEER